MLSWIPCPRHIVSQIHLDDFSKSKPASQATGFLYAWSLKVDGVTLTERKLAKRMGWTRHRSRQAIKELEAFWQDWQEGVCRPKLNQNPTKNQPKPDHLNIGRTVDIDEPATTSQPKPDQESTTHTRVIIKHKVNESKGSYLRPLGKGLKKDWMTDEVCEIWNTWFKYNPNAKVIKEGQVRVLRSALKVLSVLECCTVIEYCFDAPSGSAYVDYSRENGYTDITNILSTKNRTRNATTAEKWKSGLFHRPTSRKRRTLLDL